MEEEQQGSKRAAYGEEILITLSKELTAEFGEGFSPRNLRNFRQFYLTFQEPEIWNTLCAKLSWSHIRLIMRVDSKDAQNYYFKEAAENHWSVRTLDRNISTLYYHRLLSSQIKEPVIQEMQEKTKDKVDICFYRFDDHYWLCHRSEEKNDNKCNGISHRLK